MRKRKNSKNSTRGFTLIEILIALGVGMVLAAVAVPTVQSTLAYLRLNAVVGSVTGAISSTRYQAIMHGYKYAIAFDPATTSYQLSNSVPPATTFTNVGTPVPLTSSGGVIISTPTTLQFSPNGTVQATVGAMTFTITYAGTTKTISVSGVGRVQVQ
ncbi:MAG: prepilin-type N-terminal cleavage/methylation domain-containing protein [Candidatus Acidiferrales bacterium]